MARTALEIANHIIYNCEGDNCPCVDWSDEDRQALESMSVGEADKLTTADDSVKPIPLAPDTCVDCDADLTAGHQSSDNMRLCQSCADYNAQNDSEDADDYYDDGLEDHVDGGRYDLSDDAEALASAGWGTDEDYGYYGDD
jgi:hypothetical protein